MNKKGNIAAAVVVLLVLAVVGVGYLALKDSEFLSVAEDKELPIVCDSTTTPTVNIKSYDALNVGTALTEGTNLYRIKGQKTWSTFTAGTGFAADPGQVLEVVMGITTADMTDNAYGQKFEYTVPCAEAPSIEKEVYNDEVETSMNAVFYNADGTAAAEGFVAGQVQTISIKFGTGTDEAFGNPFGSERPNVMCLNLNSTAWDVPQWVKVGGASMSRVATPLRHSVESTHRAYCYEFPAVVDEDITLEVRLDADDASAPAVDDTAYFYAGNWFIDDDGQVGFGVENEDGTAVGTDASDSLTLDFTV